ncbi:MAG: 1-deoxy-D-xylulose-5-phosphate reductoisomerase [Eubacterium sp.]|nr:1-deoxy-D-xylulose-5-phosphate reductoisomerase [Eubacterium sp.]
MERKRIAVLGSTGSIGTQTLDIIHRNPDRFRVTALTCGKNVNTLIDQIASFSEEDRPELAVCADKKDTGRITGAFPGIRVAYGPQGLIEAAESSCDIVLNALMGMRGLVPTYHAIKAGHDIALANKETLVAGGHIIMKAIKDRGVRMLPVDSEHSAIFQCLQGNRGSRIRRILLTCSGGPFRGWTYDRLKTVTPEMALRHPNWSMGRKITIDSATMMNKGLEMIEAKWLFGVDIDDIEVLIHPQSIVHSAVEFMDTSVIAQMGIPDMRIPISVALGYPERLDNDLECLDFFGTASDLTFERPDRDAFRTLDIAVRASKAGGTYPAAMNAANEVLVQAFLDKKIGFTDIAEGIERVLDEHISTEDPDLDEVVECDREVRDIVCGRLPE